VSPAPHIPSSSNTIVVPSPFSLPCLPSSLSFQVCVIRRCRIFLLEYGSFFFLPRFPRLVRHPWPLSFPFISACPQMWLSEFHSLVVLASRLSFYLDFLLVSIPCTSLHRLFFLLLGLFCLKPRSLVLS